LTPERRPDGDLDRSPGRDQDRRVDLHAHTTASDGSLRPTKLVAMAGERGLAALAVTDHDTTAALDEAAAAAAQHGIELVSGIELNVEHPGRFHLLGYLFDPNEDRLSHRLTYLQEYRASRNDRMIEKMQAGGLPITLADVIAEAGGGLIGRPHMALALMRKGIVKSTQEAFDRFLADGGPYHVPKEKVTPEEGIRLIRQAGGVPVVAHPTTLRLAPDALEAELRKLKDIGLGGIECYYSQHTPEQQQEFVDIARRLDLVATGGSDFHGASKPHVYLGGVVDGRGVPYAVLEALRAARE